MKRLAIVCMLGFALLIAATGNAQKANTETNYSVSPNLPPPPKPEPFTVSTIPLPDSVIAANLANYLPDGRHLILEIRIAGKKKDDIGLMADDGSNFRCLTCGLKEDIGGEMPVPLPDGKRVYTPTGILECGPSIKDCKEARILPLVYPDIPGGRILMRIASNMSPDGLHVAGTLITTRGSLVLVSELTRVTDGKGDHYELQHARVVGGGNLDADARSFRPFMHGAGEVKSFLEGGRYLTCISLFESDNYDLSKIDLETGSVTRLTRHFSYDEGTYPSPDGNRIIVQTHRQTTRMDAFGLIPRPLIAGLQMAAGVAYQRNAEFEGFPDARRFYGLTMIDRYGDRARLPEEGYTGQDLTVSSDNYVSYTHFGNFAWDPTSTHGVFWEQLDPKKQQPGGPTGRLRMIRFTSRKPTKPLASYSPDLKWAVNLKDIQWPAPADLNEGKLNGYFSGYAEISIIEPPLGSKEKSRREIRYFNFSDDGEYVLNGSESSTLGPIFGGTTWNADIIVSGKRKGYLKAENVEFRITQKSSGTIRAELGKYKIEVDLSKGLPTGVPGELR